MLEGQTWRLGFFSDDFTGRQSKSSKLNLAVGLTKHVEIIILPAWETTIIFDIFNIGYLAGDRTSDVGYFISPVSGTRSKNMLRFLMKNRI